MKKFLSKYWFILFVLFLGVGIAVTNYTSQQLDNFEFWSPDSSQKVHISSVAGTVIFNVTSVSAPDTTTYWWADTVSVGDTLRFSTRYNQRYKFNVSSGPVDSLVVILFDGSRRDSLNLLPGSVYSSDYLDPAKQTKAIVKSLSTSIPHAGQSESQGR